MSYPYNPLGEKFQCGEYLYEYRQTVYKCYIDMLRRHVCIHIPKHSMLTGE